MDTKLLKACQAIRHSGTVVESVSQLLEDAHLTEKDIGVLRRAINLASDKVFAPKQVAWSWLPQGPTFASAGWVPPVHAWIAYHGGPEIETVCRLKSRSTMEWLATFANNGLDLPRCSGCKNSVATAIRIGDLAEIKKELANAS